MFNFIISGYSGLVGSEVLKLLTNEPNTTSIVLIGRKEPDFYHKKMKFYKSDFSTFPNIMPQTNLSAICCLGTTLKAVGSKDNFIKIEHDLVINFAKWSSSLSCNHFHYVSALGAHKKSKIFYNHVKGKVEESLAQLSFKSISFYRPSLLIGDRKEFRLGELILQKMSPVLNLALQGPLIKYQAIKASNVAKFIVHRSLQANLLNPNKFEIIENDQMLS